MNFNNLKEWLIDNGKLIPIGITDEHLHYAFGFIAVMLLYYFLKPIVRWITYLQWNKALTYIMVSFVMMFICTLIELHQGISGTGNMEYSDLASSTLAIFSFGIMLALVHLVSSIITQMRQKSKKAPINQQQKNA